MSIMRNISPAPRTFIDPNRSVEEQYAAFKKFMDDAPTSGRRATITPALATRILELHGAGNRPRSKKTIKDYAADMAAGNWKYTGATIVFTKSRMLRDGQHRLLAVAVSGVSIEFLLVFGIDDEAFAYMDKHRNRTKGDIFHIAKVPNAPVAGPAIRCFRILNDNPEQRSLVISNDEALREYSSMDQDHREAFDMCVANAVAITRADRNFVSSWMAAHLFRFWLLHPERLSGFVSLILNNRGVGKSLRKRTADSIKQGGKSWATEVSRNAMVIEAWNAFIEDRKVRSTEERWTNAKPFPQAA